MNPVRLKKGEKRQPNWNELVSDLVNNIEEYHKHFYERKNFTGPSLHFHNRALSASDTEKSEMIYAVLSSWGMHRMGRGGPKMKDYEIFSESILKILDRIKVFEPKKLEDISENEMDGLKEIFNTLDPMKTKIKIVAVSKILAHYLPNLIAPIDNEYTFQFINEVRGNTGRPRNWTEFDLFKSIHLNLFKEVIVNEKFKSLAEEWMKNSEFRWDTSFPKIVDNLIIGKIGDFKKEQQA